jgi:hypothetical protein
MATAVAAAVRDARRARRATRDARRRATARRDATRRDRDDRNDRRVDVATPTRDDATRWND